MLRLGDCRGRRHRVRWHRTVAAVLRATSWTVQRRRESAEEIPLQLWRRYAASGRRERNQAQLSGCHVLHSVRHQGKAYDEHAVPCLHSTDILVAIVSEWCSWRYLCAWLVRCSYIKTPRTCWTSRVSRRYSELCAAQVSSDSMR